MVERLGRCECFGDEDLLSASRRAHRAEAGQEASCLLLRVPQELYRKYLAHLHIPDFEDKVGAGGRERGTRRRRVNMLVSLARVEGGGPQS